MRHSSYLYLGKIFPSPSKLWGGHPEISKKFQVLSHGNAVHSTGLGMGDLIAMRLSQEFDNHRRLSCILRRVSRELKLFFTLPYLWRKASIRFEACRMARRFFLRSPDIKMRNIHEIFISRGDMVDIEVVQGEQMIGIVGKKAITMNAGKVLQNNICRRCDNA